MKQKFQDIPRYVTKLLETEIQCLPEISVEISVNPKINFILAGKASVTISIGVLCLSSKVRLHQLRSIH